MQFAVCYYPEQWPQDYWRKDAQIMVDMGISWVRIGEFSWSLIERNEGDYHWAWLDEAIEVLGDAGLKIILGTPTAAPPKWLIDKHPDILPVDASGHIRKFGARRHYSFSSATYRKYTAKIVEALAQRYAHNPHIHAWQIDNEYGDHDTIFSYGSEDEKAFRLWLEKKYQHIDRLNHAWGTSFWSMHYQDFNQVQLPNQLVEEPSPTHLLDYRRFSSDQVISYNKLQVDIIKKVNPSSLCVHNVMSGNTDFDHFALGKDLDAIAWDVYPLGGIINGWFSQEEKQRYYRTGHPDRNALYHELYYQVGHHHMWVMEIQPGPVNWADSNFSPEDGMFRLWIWEAFAHGAELFAPFRFRQAAYAQEQYHAGLLLQNDQEDQGAKELRQAITEIKKLDLHALANKPQKRAVALIWDYESRYALESLPQGKDYSSIRLGFEIFSAFRRLGVEVDIISKDADIDSYSLIVVPDMVITNAHFVHKLKQSNAKIIIGPRSGSKTEDFWVPSQLAPGLFQELIDVKVTRVESFPKNYQEYVEFNGQSYPIHLWRESIETSANTLATFCGPYRAGLPALVEQKNIRYLAAFPQEKLLEEILKDSLNWAKIPYQQDLPQDVRITSRGDLMIAFNYSHQSHHLDDIHDADILIGSKNIEAFGVTIWKK